MTHCPNKRAWDCKTSALFALPSYVIQGFDYLGLTVYKW